MRRRRHCDTVSRLLRCFGALLLVFVADATVAPLAAAAATPSERLVFGSFARLDNAEAFARRLNALFDREDLHVPTVANAPDGLHRVQTAPLAAIDKTRLMQRAERAGLAFWTLRDQPGVQAAGTESGAGPAGTGSAAVLPLGTTDRGVLKGTEAASSPGAEVPAGEVDGAVLTVRSDGEPQPTPAPERRLGDLRIDLGLQSRSFFESGQADQARWQPSVSVLADWYRDSADGRHALAVKGFYRVDAEDSERTHGDVREAYYGYVGDGYTLRFGLQQVFWGVSEFTHVVDVVNQTDLVEDIDGEDKLGQPLALLTFQRDWGQVELLMMPGFRERTFPGPDGRLRFQIPFAVDGATYDSGAEDRRVDGALRWSHYRGPLSFGLYHFSGTNRDPQFRLALTGSEPVIRPHYTTIDQTGLDAQWLAGDLNLKLELVSRSGDGSRYTAGNLGFEQTLVGVFGSRVDLGLVGEYLFDDRGGRAWNTLFERDFAFGTRWALNDLASTQALLAVIWDRVSDETVVSLEASRQLGRDWLLELDGRAFSGSDSLTPFEELTGFLRGINKSAFLQSDDYLQLTLKRYF
ncbi:MAG: hypothetical protein AAGG11_05795 [Pseudomonadota bacterium]